MKADRPAPSREEAMQMAGRMISRRMYSCQELFDKLVEKGVSEEDGAYCISRFLDLHLLNDSYYAGAVVRHYSKKGYGLSRVKAELKRHGIPDELFDEALEEMPSSDTFIDDYIAEHLSDPSDKKAVKKTTDALFRRGFSWEDIRAALNRYEE